VRKKLTSNSENEKTQYKTRLFVIYEENILPPTAENSDLRETASIPPYLPLFCVDVGLNSYVQVLT
jgi:hypothetical protein